MRRLLFLSTTALLLGAFTSGCSSKDEPSDPGTKGELSIEFFRASPTTVAAGGKSSLSWKTHNAVTVRLFARDVEIVSKKENQGSFTVSVPVTTTYRLVAEGASGDTKEESLVVEVKQEGGPEVTFSATDTTMEFQGSTTLRWETNDAARVVITAAGSGTILDTDRPADAGLLSGEKAVSPDRGVVYQLVATSASGGTTTRSVEIVVIPAIAGFGPQEPDRPLESGSPIDLSWEVHGADSVEITTPEGFSYVVPAGDREAGTLEATAANSGVFVLRATRGNGVATKQHRVRLMKLPSIETFTVMPGTIDEGQPSNVRLIWTVTNADTVAITADDGREILPASEEFDGNLVIEASTTTVLTLVATNALGQATREATIRAVGQLAIHSFTAVPNRVQPGGMVRLSWSTANATTLSLSGDAPIEIGQEADGFVDVTVESQTRFDFAAEGAIRRESRFAWVEIGAPVIDSFAPAAIRYLPDEPIVLNWIGRGGRTATIEAIERDGDGVIVAQTPVCTVEFPQVAYAGSCTDPAPRDFGRHEYRLALVDGAAAAVVSTTALVSDGPVIETFSVGPTTVTANEPVTLRWRVRGDAAGNTPELTLTVDDAVVDVPELAANPLAGQAIVSFPDAGVKRLKLTATSSGRTIPTDEREISLTVVEPEPQPGLRFQVPETASAGSTITIEWDTGDGSSAILTPSMGVPAASTTASFEDIADTGTPVTITGCGGSDPTSEGCGAITFEDGFTFPFDGIERTSVEAYVNGFLSFDIGAAPGEVWSNGDFPSSPASYVHLAPFWDDLDLSMGRGPGRILYEQKTGDQGAYLIVQWSHVGADLWSEWFSSPRAEVDLNFQVVLWENGAVDFRYGLMSAPEQDEADGSNAVIGYQDTTRATSNMIVSKWSSGTAGGLSNRAWRYFESTRSDAGRADFVIQKTTIFTLCVDQPDGRVCEKRTVVVP